MRHLRALASSVTNFGKKWSTFLPLTQRIINASWHSAIGSSPARLLFAGRLNLDKGILPSSPTQSNGGEGEGTISLTPQEASDFVLELAKAQDALLRQSVDFQNDYFASRNGAPPSAPTSYELGDLVVYKPPNRSSKLETVWRGPFTVVDRQDDIYTVKDPASDQTQRLHLERLKPFKLALDADAAAISARDNNLYLVDRILRHRFTKSANKQSAVEFEVAWLGYDCSFNEWLPLRQVSHLYLFPPYLALHPSLRAKIERGSVAKR